MVIDVLMLSAVLWGYEERHDMKLRNKKTGELGELQTSQKHIAVAVGNGTSEVSITTYDSINELNKEWGDVADINVTNIEPYIKDKKIRKVVRVWADVNILSELQYDKDKDCLYSPYGSDSTDTSVSISFDDINIFKELEHRHVYTTDELCGK